MADRSGYIGRAPGDSTVIIARQSYEPTGVTTDFTLNAGYDPGYVDVYKNGLKLIQATEFNATDGSTVGLTSAAVNGDAVEIVAYKAFNLGQSVSDVAGNFDVGGNLTVDGSITVNTSIVGSAVTSNASGIDVTGVVTATSFVGDGSNLTGMAAGLGTALGDSNPLDKIFKTPRILHIGAGTSVSVNSDATSGLIAFCREAQIQLGTGATFAIGSGTTFITDTLEIF